MMGFVFTMKVQSQLTSYLVGTSSQLYKGVLKILHDQVLSIAITTCIIMTCMAACYQPKIINLSESLTQQIHFLLDHKDAGYSLAWLDPILHRSTNIITCSISESHILNSQLSSLGHLARAALGPCKTAWQLTIWHKLSCVSSQLAWQLMTQTGSDGMLTGHR